MRIPELMDDGLRLYAQAAADHARDPDQQTLIRVLCAASQAWGAACAIAAILRRNDVDGHTILVRCGRSGHQLSAFIREITATHEVDGVILDEG